MWERKRSRDLKDVSNTIYLYLFSTFSFWIIFFVSTFPFRHFPFTYFLPVFIRHSPLSMSFFSTFSALLTKDGIFILLYLTSCFRDVVWWFFCGRSVAFLWYCWFESDFYTCFFVKLIVYFIICNSIQSTNGQL